MGYQSKGSSYKDFRATKNPIYSILLAREIPTLYLFLTNSDYPSNNNVPETTRAAREQTYINGTNEETVGSNSSAQTSNHQ